MKGRGFHLSFAQQDKFDIFSLSFLVCDRKVLWCEILYASFAVSPLATAPIWGNFHIIFYYPNGLVIISNFRRITFVYMAFLQFVRPTYLLFCFCFLFLIWGPWVRLIIIWVIDWITERKIVELNDHFVFFIVFFVFSNSSFFLKSDKFDSWYIKNIDDLYNLLSLIRD